MPEVRRGNGTANGYLMSGDFPPPWTGKYTIELCRPGGPYNGIEGVIISDDNLVTARKLYRFAAAADPERVILLCDGGRILARSDEPDTMPE